MYTGYSTVRLRCHCQPAPGEILHSLERKGLILFWSLCSCRSLSLSCLPICDFWDQVYRISACHIGVNVPSSGPSLLSAYFIVVFMVQTGVGILRCPFLLACFTSFPFCHQKFTALGSCFHWNYWVVVEISFWHGLCVFVGIAPPRWVVFGSVITFLTVYLSSPRRNNLLSVFLRA